MTYFAITCETKKFKANLEVSEALLTHVTKRENALHIGAGHSNNNAIFPDPELIRGNLSAEPLSISAY